MRKSDIDVTMPMTTFEELENYKKLYVELKGRIRSCFKPSVDDGIDYLFNVNEALELMRNETNISKSLNIEITYDKKIGG